MADSQFQTSRQDAHRTPFLQVPILNHGRKFMPLKQDLLNPTFSMFFVLDEEGDFYMYSPLSYKEEDYLNGNTY